MTSETHQTILQVARRLFIRQGYTATSIREIAEEAGIGKATIYHHFPDKTAIIMELMRQAAGNTLDIFTTVRAEGDPRRRIEANTLAMMRWTFNTVDLFQVIRREVPNGRALMAAELPNAMGEQLRILTTTIQEGIDSGIFRQIDPNAAARVLLMMIQGSFVRAFIGMEVKQSPEETAASMLDVFFHGIDKP
jgi:AcrR family transcriptional regulator